MPPPKMTDLEIAHKWFALEYAIQSTERWTRAAAYDDEPRCHAHNTVGCKCDQDAWGDPECTNPDRESDDVSWPDFDDY